MKPEAVVDQLSAQLREVGTPERAENEKAYLKSDLAFLGATVPQIRRVAKDVHRAHGDAGRLDVIAVTEALWARGIHELRMAAVELLDLYGDLLGPDDLPLLERLIRESRTWALVDPLAATVAGGIVDRHPGPTDAVVRRWAGDPDFWVRRSALLVHLGPLRRGEGDFDRFGEIADRMLEEREFFVRKAIGWVLRDTARRRPELVVAWLEPRAARAAGLTVREAVKHLPAEDRERILAARG